MRFFWQRKPKATDVSTTDVTDVNEKAITGVTDISALVPTRSATGFMGIIRESFAGAWQKGFTVNSRQTVMAFSAVFRCVSAIAQDIAKMRIQLVELKNGIWTEVDITSPYWPVLRKPNNYQNHIQFIIAWLCSKLMYGNTFVLKVRDQRGIVVMMHVLDPRRVTPLVTVTGDVYYQLGNDDLSQVGTNNVVVPATEMIHDRGVTLFHPLVGISPLFACAIAATQGNKIQENSAMFFDNMSRPSGFLSSPLTIKDSVAADYKKRWEENFTNGGVGKVAVLGDQLSYNPLAMNAVDADLVKQLDWTVQDVARAFGVPLYKIGVTTAGVSNDVEVRQQQYYDDTLQIYIEAIEACLDEGLSLDRVQGKQYGTQFDLHGLMRMDSKGMADYLDKIVGAGVMAPNEGRAMIDLPDVAGGDTPYMQQQNFSLAALQKRDASADPFKTADKAPASTPAAAAAPAKDEGAAKFIEAMDAVMKTLATMNEKMSTQRDVPDLEHLLVDKEAAELAAVAEFSDILVEGIDALINDD